MKISAKTVILFFSLENHILWVWVWNDVPARAESNCLRLLQVSSGVCGSLSLCKPWAHHLTEHTSSRPWYLTLHLTRWHSSSNLEKKRPESAYQSLNHCLTALQQKTHLIQEMADKPSEILRPCAEHLKSSSAIRGFLCIDTAMSIASYSHYCWK